MDAYRLLDNPTVYNLKSTLVSLGRNSVGRFLRTAGQLPAGARVLDVGCGTGRHAPVFAVPYFGIDANPRYLAYAKANRRGAFTVMDVTRLGFPDSSFDLVFCVGLLHHLGDNEAQAAVREMRRVARHSGRVLIIEGVFPGAANPVGNVLFGWDRGEHTRSVEALGNLLAVEGFHMVLGNIPGSFPYRRAVFSNR